MSLSLREMNLNDHDLLIRISAQLDLHIANSQEAHTNAQTQTAHLAGELKGLNEKIDRSNAALGAKLDAFRETLVNLAFEFKNDHKRLNDMDIRVASLEHKVEAAEDAVEKSKAVNEAMQKAHEEQEKTFDRRLKRWTFITGSVSFILGVVIPNIQKIIDVFK